MLRTLATLMTLAATPLAAQVAPLPPVPPQQPTPPTAPMPAPRPMPAFQSFDVDAFSNLNFDLKYQIDSRLNDLSSLSYATTYANDYSYNYNTAFGYGFGNSGGLPVAWAQQDPADSLYRMARDQFSRGDYRRSADLFKSLPTRYPSSAYVADAQYWQAFSLYRIGTTPDLQQALAVLEARKPATDNASGSSRGSGSGGGMSGNGMSVNSANKVRTTTQSDDVRPAPMTVYTSRGGGNTDAAGLAARIANVLSSRGMSSDAAVKRALAAGGNSCDEDEQSVRAEALSALMQNDPATGQQMAAKILGSRDECSAQLRRNAVMLVASRNDDAATTTLISVAKSDPNNTVRYAALDYLARLQSDAATNAVIDIARTSDDKQVQRMAVRSLAQSSNAKARAEVRSLVENNATDDALRTSILDGFDRDKMTTEDAAWLRGLYTRTTSARVKERIITAVARAGGDANNQWVMTLVRNEDEPLEARTAALQRVGTTLDVAALVKIYDMSAQRPIREATMQLLSMRKEPEALDKIVDIAKNGTDTNMRREAINILSRSKDPRASKLLLQLVDH